MVPEVDKAKALKMTTTKYVDWFQCNKCRDMFSNMIHFEGWNFYDCIPKRCPNCGREFENGMEAI